MTLYVNGIEKKVSLCAWDEANNQWTPNCFNDLECNIIDGSDLTPEQYKDMVDYWESEVETYNNGGFSESLGDPEESRYKEFGFWYDDL